MTDEQVPNDVPTGDLPEDEPTMEDRVDAVVAKLPPPFNELPREFIEKVIAGLDGFAKMGTLGDSIARLAAAHERLADAVEHFNGSNDNLIDYETRGIK